MSKLFGAALVRRATRDDESLHSGIKMGIKNCIENNRCQRGGNDSIVIIIFSLDIVALSKLLAGQIGSARKTEKFFDIRALGPVAGLLIRS